jgi:hypothetical protein
MNIYVSVLIEGVEEDACLGYVAAIAVAAVQAQFIYNDVSLNESEVA